MYIFSGYGAAVTAVLILIRAIRWIFQSLDWAETSRHGFVCYSRTDYCRVDPFENVAAETPVNPERSSTQPYYCYLFLNREDNIGEFQIVAN